MTRQRGFVHVVVPAAMALLASAGHASELGLRFVDRTALQIAIAWDTIPDASAYRVERSTDTGFAGEVISYGLPATVTGFGDTGWPLDDVRRFRQRSTAAASPQYHLAADVEYYYRVIAETPSGDRFSNISGPHRIADFHSFTEVTRGVAGDLWADAVLKQVRFGENTWWGTTPLRIQYGGGVVVDRHSSHPTRIYLIDGNHNRILGIEALGECRSSQAPCSIDSDCAGDVCDLRPGQSPPAFILGQSSGYDLGACNGDGTRQVFPNLESASASTLCFVRPDQISMAETVIYQQGAVDAEHNLYVPDDWNNRVLMFRDPFDPNNGTAASEVWGQDSFSDVMCNKGLAAPTLSTLCRPQAVEIDAAGNLWVVDWVRPNENSESRVLRFPRDPVSGEIAKTADLALTGLSVPRGVRVDASGDVYVTDRSGLHKFANPVPPGSSTSELLGFLNSDPNYAYPTHFAFDPTRPGHLWMALSWNTHALVDLVSETIEKKVFSGQFRGLDVSRDGDLFSVEAWDHQIGLMRLGATQTTAEHNAGDLAFLGFGRPTPETALGVISIATAGHQLLVSDRYFVHFWDDYRSITEADVETQPANGSWGQSDADYLLGGGRSYRVKSDESGRIWINDVSGQVKIFTSPLTSSSVPVKALSISFYKDHTGTVVPLPAGVDVFANDLRPVGSGDRVWIFDEESSRALRVVNIDGVEDPGAPPYVDMVLGQSDWFGTECNRGSGPWEFRRDTLCREGQIGLDANDNLYIQENFTAGMDGGSTRILRWNAGTIPDSPPRTLFGILPDSVYGNGERSNFELEGYPCDPSESACTVRAAAFDGDWIMALGGTNPYTGPRFPLVYLNRHHHHQPQLALGDFVSFPSASHVDPDGNLYLGDYNWNRVLVYKRPFAAFDAPPGTPAQTPGTPTPTSPNYTATPSATATPPPPTPTHTATQTPCGGVSAAMQFGGNRQVVSIPDFAAFPSGPGAELTISMWVRTDGNAQTVFIAKSGQGTGNQTFFVERWDQHFIVNFAEFTSVAVTNSDTIAPGEWFHFALVYDGSGSTDNQRLRIFVNGLQRSFSLLHGAVPSSLVDSTAPLEVGGCSARSSHLQGTIDEVRLYDVALDQQTVLEHYAAGAGSCTHADAAHLVAGYHLDETSGNFASDVSGNGRDGLISSGIMRVAGIVCCPESSTPTPTFTYMSTATWSQTPTLAPSASAVPSPTRTPLPPVATTTPTPACNGEATVQRVQFKVSRNGNPLGDERLGAQGRVQLAVTDPPVDPVANGFTIAVKTKTGESLFERIVPAGAAASNRDAGWSANRSATRFTYRDRTGSAAGGIRRVVVSRHSDSSFSTFGFSIRGIGPFHAGSDQLPLQVDVIFGGAAQGAAGQCAGIRFAATAGEGPYCRELQNGRRILCR